MGPMRAVLVALALLVGLGSTPAFAKDAVLVKLRDGDAPAKHAAAKPAPTAKKSTTRAKKKPPARKTVAKSKPSSKKTSSKKKSESKSEEPRLRPMP